MPGPFTTLDKADLRVASDASDEGWGLYFEGTLRMGKWSPTDASLHINVKELIVLRIFLQDFFPSVRRDA